MFEFGEMQEGNEGKHNVLVYNIVGLLLPKMNTQV